jgi:hypothetical protein
VDAAGLIFNEKELTAQRAGSWEGVRERSSFRCRISGSQAKLELKPRAKAEACAYGQAGRRPRATWGKMPSTKIRSTMMTMATIESLLTGMAVPFTAAGCQYMAFTTFR